MPIGISHKCREEEIYKGYVSPASIVFIIHLWFVLTKLQRCDRSLTPTRSGTFSVTQEYGIVQNNMIRTGRESESGVAAGSVGPGQHLVRAVSMHYCAIILLVFNLRVPDGEAVPTLKCRAVPTPQPFSHLLALLAQSALAIQWRSPETGDIISSGDMILEPGMLLQSS